MVLWEENRNMKKHNVDDNQEVDNISLNTFLLLVIFPLMYTLRPFHTPHLIRIHSFYKSLYKLFFIKGNPLIQENILNY